MTPENVLRASELIRLLKSYRTRYRAAETATGFTIETNDLMTWSAHKGDELFGEIQSLLISQVTGDIARTEQELGGLGVTVPTEDFVNLPSEAEAAARP